MFKKLREQTGWVVSDPPPSDGAPPKKPEPGGILFIDDLAEPSPFKRQPLAAVKKNRVVESMTRYQTPQYTVRVWREQADLSAPNNDDIIMALSMASERRDLIEAVESLEGVVAVEVLDHAGNGLILYPDWK